MRCGGGSNFCRLDTLPQREIGGYIPAEILRARRRLNGKDNCPVYEWRNNFRYGSSNNGVIVANDGHLGRTKFYWPSPFFLFDFLSLTRHFCQKIAATLLEKTNKKL